MMRKILLPASELWANSDFPCEIQINMPGNRETPWTTGGAMLAIGTPALGGWGREKRGVIYLTLM